MNTTDDDAYSFNKSKHGVAKVQMACAQIGIQLGCTCRRGNYSYESRVDDRGDERVKSDMTTREQGHKEKERRYDKVRYEESQQQRFELQNVCEDRLPNDQHDARSQKHHRRNPIEEDIWI